MTQKKRKVCIVHYNTPEITQAAIWSLRKHGGEDYEVLVFDNSDERPFTAKMKGVTVFDNTKGQIIDFEKELEKYPDRDDRIGCAKGCSYGSDKHMMSIQKLWELLPDGFVLMDSDVLIKENIDWMFWEGECCCGYISTASAKHIPRLMPMLLWINVPMCKAAGARFFDPDRSWALHDGLDNPKNFWDTGAAFLDDIKRLKPQCHGKAISRERILHTIVHLKMGSWKQNDPTLHERWLKQYEDLWLPSPRMRGIQDVAICAIGRNENRYAVEWVEHYLKLEVKKIYIYDNGFKGEEHVADVLGKYIQKGQVDIVDWRDRNYMQNEAYNDCYAKHGNEYAWIGFFDFDEFLNIGKKKSLPTLMKTYGDADAVLVNWRIFTDSGRTHYDAEGVKKRFTVPMKPDTHVKYDFPENNHIKSFVRGGIVGLKFHMQPHVPHSPQLKCVNANKGKVSQKPFTEYDPSVMVLDHYTTKTAEEFVEKVKRGFPLMEPYNTTYRKHAVEYFFAINERTEEKEKILAEGGLL